jgi:iron complex outermembrane recepter protein
LKSYRLILLFAVQMLSNVMVFAQQTGGSGASPSGQSAAEAESTNVLQEIVITAARRRSEDIQQTPLAVTVLSPNALQEAHVVDLPDLTPLLTNVQIYTISAGPDALGIYIRGLGTSAVEPSAEPGVPVYIDGVYQAQTFGSLVDVFDVQSIEVLKGPQATLFGFNSPSGAVLVTTKRPDGHDNVEFQIDYGTYNSTQVRALGNLSLVPGVLKMKASVFENYMDNYVYDDAIGRDEEGGVNRQTARIGIEYTPNDRLDWYVDGDYARDGSPQTQLRAVSSTSRDQTPAYTDPLAPLACTSFQYCNVTPDRYTTDAGYTHHEVMDRYDITSNLSYRFDPVTLTSITGYRDSSQDAYIDLAGVAIPILNVEGETLITETESQEVRLNSNKGQGWDLDGKLDWLVGASYFHGTFDDHQPLDIGGVGLLYQMESQDQSSEALFAHAVYKLTDQWNVSTGARRTYDHKLHHSTADGYPQNLIASQGGSWSNTSYEAGTQYQFTPDKMAYFRFAQGYRGGGFSGEVSPAEGAAVVASNKYNPETDNDYEVGIKTDWFDKHLRINADVFDEQFKNLQRSITTAITLPGGGSSFFQGTQNAATATFRGAELETIVIPVDPVALHADVGFLDAFYNHFVGNIVGVNYSGLEVSTNNADLPLARAPRWTLNLGGDYTVDAGGMGSFKFNAAWNYLSRQNLSENGAQFAEIPGYGLVNISAQWADPSHRFGVSVYVKNVFDTHYYSYAVDNGPFADVVADGLPTTVGVALSAKFGDY